MAAFCVVEIMNSCLPARWNLRCSSEEPYTFRL